MKRNNIAGRKDGPLRVHAPKRLVYDRGEWHIDTTRVKKSDKAVPSHLAILPLVKAIGALADSLDLLLAVQEEILASIYENLGVGFDVLESAQSELIDGIRECLQTVRAYEKSVRITVEIILGRKLPYECPQDHASMSSDMCCNCGMTLQAFSILASFEDHSAKTADKGLFAGLGVLLRPDVE